MKIGRLGGGVLILAMGILAFSVSSCSSKKSTNSGGAGFISTTSIDISGFAFNPLRDSVAVGTTITWTNRDANTTHTVTSDQSSLFDSGPLVQNDTWPHQFNTVGDFMYHCTVHGSMTHGTIRVR